MQHAQAEGCELYTCHTHSLAHTHTHTHTLGKCNKRKPKGANSIHVSLSLSLSHTLGKRNKRKPKGVNSIHVSLSLTHTHTYTHQANAINASQRVWRKTSVLTGLIRSSKASPPGIFFYLFFLRSARRASINT